MEIQRAFKLIFIQNQPKRNGNMHKLAACIFCLKKGSKFLLEVTPNPYNKIKILKYTEKKENMLNM